MDMVFSSWWFHVSGFFVNKPSDRGADEWYNPNDKRLPNLLFVRVY